MKYKMNKKEELVNNIINGVGGNFFSVEFYKTNGKLRKMACRRKVGKFVTGVGLSYSPEERGQVVVWEADKSKPGKENYRILTLDRVKTLKAGQNSHSFKCKEDK